jgi:hypothetical protein
MRLDANAQQNGDIVSIRISEDGHIGSESLVEFCGALTSRIANEVWLIWVFPSTCNVFKRAQPSLL